MDFAVLYLARRVLFRIWSFFDHWYVHGSLSIGHYFLNILEKIDQSLAIRVTFRHFFEPLYKDYSVIGRILGVIFRSGRILIGLVVYGVLIILGILVYLVWMSLPLLLIYQTIKNLL